MRPVTVVFAHLVLIILNPSVKALTRTLLAQVWLLLTFATSSLLVIPGMP